VPTDLAFALAGLILIGASVRIAREGERLAILRLGRFIGVRGPGLVWILPFIEKTIRVALDRDLPNWRSLTSDQLAKEIGRRLTASGLEG
jgi:regulator of protease activity HflC (stomatin/prohibitin superfamily)